MKGKLKRTLIVLAIAAGIVFIPYLVSDIFFLNNHSDIVGMWSSGFIALIISILALLVFCGIYIIVSEYIKTGRI